MFMCVCGLLGANDFTQISMISKAFGREIVLGHVTWNLRCCLWNPVASCVDEAMVDMS